MVGQYGTHVDPPAHFAENGITMDKIPLKQMILPLVVLDDTPYLAKDPDHAFSIDDLKAWERQHGRVPKGALAALRTDILGRRSQALRAQPVSGLGVRNNQISVRRSRRDGDRA
jgi:kynurenine formamidase